MECRDVEKIFENKNSCPLQKEPKRDTLRLGLLPDAPWRMKWCALTYEMVRLDGQNSTPWRVESCAKADLETHQGELSNSSRAF